jgi:SAM-dependent methyltransferase
VQHLNPSPSVTAAAASTDQVRLHVCAVPALSAGVTTDWVGAADEYQELLVDPTADSEFLRSTLVVPNLLRLAGDVTADRVLDAGCGSGWLHDRVVCASADACDISTPAAVPGHVRFSRADLTALPYRDSCFDTVLSNLVLIWVTDLAAAYRELYRVTAPGGQLVASYVHPTFYRRFVLDDAGRPVIVEPLSAPISEPVRLAGKMAPLPFPSHSVADHVNAAADAGWSTVRLEDVFLNMDDYRRRGLSSPVPRTGDVPMFMFGRFVRR